MINKNVFYLFFIIVCGFYNTTLPAAEPVSYTKDVKPILDSRCVACHACFDSPCQLNLSAFEGLQRGASKNPVYDHQRFRAVEPSRLFIDETSSSGWRNKGFFPVLNEQAQSPEANIDNALLAKTLLLKRENPLPEGKLPKAIELELERSLQCPTPDEFAKHQQNHPLWGMPYGLPALSQTEETTLLNWLKQGANSDAAKPALSAQAAAEINKWERFFNGASLKQQLSARYLYEHLYIGDLHFKGHPNHEFYKLVRSATPTGQPVDELKSVRPFDAPGIARFYYRLRPVTSTIVDKNHFVFELSDNKMQRFEALFLKPDYRITHLPGYEPQAAANPFKTFSQLPAASRYQFLLDDAQYFFSGFIKGPVCRGQASLNVIRDQFWVAFVKPQTAVDRQYTEFLADHSRYLQMPASDGENIGFLEWREYNPWQRHYLQQKEIFNTALQQPVDLNLLWDGGGDNDNALLTVLRHFDSATVVKGWLGKPPLTAWVVDYPLFERIHYLLAAGFNVSGSIGHQVSTRLYMDFLRMEAENNFLKFIPLNRRKALHDSWYEGIDLKIFNFFETPIFNTDKEPAIPYQTTAYKDEFFQRLQQRLGRAGGQPDLINRCAQTTCNDASQIDVLMRQLADLKGKEIGILPELSFLRIKTANPAKDRVYTLVRNQKLLNVSFIFGENLRREPEKDTLTVVSGFLGSYPNMFFGVTEAQLPAFIEQLKHSQSTADSDLFYSTYGIRRSNPEIWDYYDWFNQKYQYEQPESWGLFDMNRYENL
ncbi:MAG: fatty acid cis/trans isomerase [Methylobacter sp.]|nr:fatty acid cis/trans isomerase [Methylobacter sp.]